MIYNYQAFFTTVSDIYQVMRELIVCFENVFDSAVNSNRKLKWFFRLHSRDPKLQNDQSTR